MPLAGTFAWALGEVGEVGEVWTHGWTCVVRYLEVLTEREVSMVEHNANGVKVHVRGGGDGIQADAVLVTVPLGVLKAKSITFAPPLPVWKRAAIDRLGFGPIEKIVLLFERRFWDEGADFFGVLPPEGIDPAELAARRGEVQESPLSPCPCCRPCPAPIAQPPNPSSNASLALAPALWPESRQ